MRNKIEVKCRRIQQKAANRSTKMALIPRKPANSGLSKFNARN